MSATLTFAALVFWVGRDWILAGYVLGGSLITLVILAALSYLLIRLINRIRHGVSVTWRFGIAALARRFSDFAFSAILNIFFKWSLVFFLSAAPKDMLIGNFSELSNSHFIFILFCYCVCVCVG